MAVAMKLLPLDYMCQAIISRELIAARVLILPAPAVPAHIS